MIPDRVDFMGPFGWFTQVKLACRETAAFFQELKGSLLVTGRRLKFCLGKKKIASLVFMSVEDKCACARVYQDYRAAIGQR